MSFAHAFVFRDGMYAGERLYRRRWRPARRFPGPDSVPAFDGAEDGGETQCARALDSLPGVKHWIRNVAQHPASFRLPTAAGPDALEKRAVGELWESRSAGRCLFAMVEKEAAGKDMRRQLLDKTGVA